MNDMNWQQASIVGALAYLVFLVVICAIPAARKRKLRRLLDRLNSPFFRNVYDAYYRASNLN